MVFVLPRTRKRAASRALVIGAVAISGWAMATAGSTAMAAPGDAENPEVTTTTAAPTTTTTTAAPATNPGGKNPPGQIKKKPTTPPAATAPPAAVSAPAPTPVAPHKIIVRKYVEAPAGPTREQTAPATPAPTPEVAISAPAAETTPDVLPVEAPAEVVEKSAAPVIDQVPGELALAENASITTSGAGPNIGLVSMIAGALSVAVLGLGLSTLLFHRFGAVGAHGRAVSLSFAPLSHVSGILTKLRSSRAVDEPETPKLTSADFALCPVTTETPVIKDETAS